MLVAVTGSSGRIGRALVGLLDEMPSVKRIVGIDVTDPAKGAGKLEFYRLDVRSDALAGVAGECDVVIHLAGDSGPDALDVAVAGARNVAALGRRVIFASDTRVYGAHADNDYPLTEKSLVRPVLGHGPSQYSADAEETFTRPDVCVLRMAPAPDFAGSILKVSGYDPSFQVLSATDAARSIVHVLENNLTGIYNVAPSDALVLSRASALSGRRGLGLGIDEAGRRLGRSPQAGLFESGRQELPFLLYPWSVSSAAFAATGFEYKRNCVETVTEAKAPTAVAFRPRNIAIAAATAAAVVGSLARRKRMRDRV